MKLKLLELLICIKCGSNLILENYEEEKGEVKKGMLVCSECKSSYPIVDFIPRFIETDRYVKTFSFEWNVFYDVQIDILNNTDESEETFKYKTGFKEEDVKGKLFLDAGVGSGRFAEIVSRWKGEVVGFDLSYAVDAAFKNIGERPNVHIVQADIFNPPFKKEVFDHIYSIGVLHHTPDTKKAFESLVPLLKKKGAFAVFIYEKTNYHIFSDIWRKITKRLPLRVVYIITAIAIPLYYLYKIPFLGTALQFIFPISNHPKWKWRWLDTFDWYTPRYQWKHTYPEVYGWFKENGFTDMELFDYPICIRGIKQQ
jgi:SAM-dependent methyltransferase